MRSVLIRNFLREIYSTLPRLVAVIIVTALGVMIYVGMSGYAYNLIQIADSYYAGQNAADYWLYGSGLTKLDERRIAELGTVESVQSRISTQVEYDRDETINLSLHGIAGEWTINKPYIVAGTMFASSRELMLDESHALAHHIQIGDRMVLRDKVTKQKLVFTVSALIRSPEYVYNVSGAELVPDPYKNGFAYVKEDALGSIKKLVGYSDFNVVLRDSADEQQFKDDLQRILGTRLLRLLKFEDNMRSSILKDQIKETEALTTSLPALFFLIAAFIMFTTMSTIVENNRTMIGTLKALGYGRAAILGYFLCHAFTVVILGTSLGTLPAGLITKQVMNLVSTSMAIPDYAVMTDYSAILKCMVLTMVICVGAAALACIRELKYVPAECMRPRPPKVGRMNFFERIKPLWTRMTFVQKTITRNIVRSRARLAMCVIGVAGCMAIIVTALGFRDSTTHFMNTMYTNLHRYDLQVTLKAGTPTLEAERLQKLAGLTKAEYVMEQPVRALSANNSQDTILNVMQNTVSLMVPFENAPGVMVMPATGAIVSSSMANKLNLTKGDSFQFVLAGRRKILTTDVVDIQDNISGLYISQSLWRQLGEGFAPSTVYIAADDPTALADRIRGYDFVASVKSKGEIVKSIEDQLGMMNAMAFILIMFGGVLDLVVLYNLGILNFYERMRELATLKVLGFMSNEIAALVLRENAIFSFLGISLGVPLGIALHAAMLSKSSTQDMTFVPFIDHLSFLLAAGLTFIFSLLVNMLLRRKLRGIDMLGALKSIE